MHKRAFALCALLVLLGSCTRVDRSATNASGERHAWTQAGHLRYGSAYEPDSLNPLLANTQAANDVAYLIFEPLFRYDPDGNLVPAAATEVPTQRNGGISADGKTITLHFRRGMRWSDGAPYDARDLLFTWRAVMNPHNNTRLRDGWDDIVSITLRDRYTPVIRLRDVHADILGSFAVGGSGFPPLPAHLLAGVDLNHAAFNANPISSGPFVLKNWIHGSSLEFAANPTYWRGPPGLKTISYRFIPSAPTLLAQIKTHEIDVYDSVDENQIDAVRALGDGTAVAKRLIANWRRLAFNLRRPPLSERAVRLAVAESVDWDRMNRTLFHGYNTRAVSDIVPNSWAAPNVPQYRYDVAGARRLLDAAGWRAGPDGVRRKAGRPLTFTVSTTNAKLSNVESEEQMQQELKAVGIALTIKNYPGSLLFARDGPIYSGAYDSEFTIETNGPDPNNEGYWSGRYIPPHGTNSDWLDDPLINRVSRAAAQTYDHATRKRLLQQEETRIHELVPAVFFYWQNSYSVYNDDFQNWQPATYISNFWNCWSWRI